MAALPGNKLVHAGHDRVFGFFFVVFLNGFVDDELFDVVGLQVPEFLDINIDTKLGFHPADACIEVKFRVQHHLAFAEVDFLNRFTGQVDEMFV